MRNTLLVLHILGVATWFGANIVLVSNARRSAEAAADIRRWWAETLDFMSRTLYPAAGMTVLFTGIGLVLDSSAYEFSDTFVTVGFTAIIVGIVLGVTVFGPNARRTVEAIDSSDETSEHSINRKVGIFGSIDTLVLVVAVAAMVSKWGLG